MPQRLSCRRHIGREAVAAEEDRSVDDDARLSLDLRKSGIDRKDRARDLLHRDALGLDLERHRRQLNYRRRRILKNDLVRTDLRGNEEILRSRERRPDLRTEKRAALIAILHLGQIQKSESRCFVGYDL